MSRRRVLLVGHGRIGREVFGEYRHLLTGETLMVVDPMASVPVGYEWDRGRVDIAVIMVDTPAADSRLSGFDYGQLTMALGQSLSVADAIVIRSTVELGFLELEMYAKYADDIGFAPEFYGATRHSARGQLDLPFAIFSDTVPEWFRDLTSVGRKQLVAPAAEVIVAKLAENAYLATKVTFFHELSVQCWSAGLDFDVVRELVTSDPRITPYHSYCDEGLGWSSHCFDKDVPVLADLAAGHRLVQAVLELNAEHLCEEKADPPIGL